MNSRNAPDAARKKAGPGKLSGEGDGCMEMDERKMRILQAIIDDYILTGVPVGSRTISRKYDMGLSSAISRMCPRDGSPAQRLTGFMWTAS